MNNSFVLLKPLLFAEDVQQPTTNPTQQFLTLVQQPNKRLFDIILELNLTEIASGMQRTVYDLGTTVLKVGDNEANKAEVEAIQCLESNGITLAPKLVAHDQKTNYQWIVLEKVKTNQKITDEQKLEFTKQLNQAVKVCPNLKLDDLHTDNFGINSSGNLVVIDWGGAVN